MTSALNYSEVTHRAFVDGLVYWHKDHRLAFPWREYKSPFQILITEVLLRKTNAEKVQDLIDTVIERIGTLLQLQAIGESELTCLLKPFGMQYRKAAELKRMAEIIGEEFNGRVPSTSQELAKLPGVGRYIASAVLAFGFSQPEVVVDTNVIRVLRRYFGLESKRSRARDDPRFWEFAENLVPKGSAVDFNYAVIDFAKQVCTARKPLCSECPLNRNCYYFQTQATN